MRASHVANLRSLYPAIEPFQTTLLPVGDGHVIYVEQSGNPRGKPVIFVHGGPGGGTDPAQRRFWDPATYRIILFDQRGCGRSTPYASLEHNTTPHLVSDMEAIREHLEVDRWQVFGGSWGSTLSLAYAERYPERVTELVLRGIFLLRTKELRWFYQEGASRLFPDVWESYVNFIPEEERGDLLLAYHRRLTSDDRKMRLEAARRWSLWEGRTSRLERDPSVDERFGDARFAEAFARIEAHYFVHRGFFSTETELLDRARALRDIPGILVHGRYDVICPVENAWELSKAWPQAELVIVSAAGHSANEPGIASELVKATDRFR